MFLEDGKSRAISAVGKRILKSGIGSKDIDRKGGISDIKISQKSGNAVSDLLMESGIFLSEFSVFYCCWNCRLVVYIPEEYGFFKIYLHPRFTSR